jgi:hypothetical protein
MQRKNTSCNCSFCKEESNLPKYPLLLMRVSAINCQAQYSAKWARKERKRSTCLPCEEFSPNLRSPRQTEKGSATTPSFLTQIQNWTECRYFQRKDNNAPSRACLRSPVKPVLHYAITGSLEYVLQGRFGKERVRAWGRATRLQTIL